MFISNPVSLRQAAATPPGADVCSLLQHHMRTSRRNIHHATTHPRRGCFTQLYCALPRRRVFKSENMDGKFCAGWNLQVLPNVVGGGKSPQGSDCRSRLSSLTGEICDHQTEISTIRLPFEFPSCFETRPLHCDRLAQGALITCSAYLYVTLMEREIRHFQTAPGSTSITSRQF